MGWEEVRTVPGCDGTGDGGRVEGASPGAARPLAGARVLLVIAPERFRDEEYREPRAVIEEAGGHVTVAAARRGRARGMLGLEVDPDITLDRVRAEDYDAVVFVGGSGASVYWDDPTAHALARRAAELGRVVGAICIAPVTLARAGLLRGRRATCWPAEAKELEAAGARCTGNPVEEDGLLVTGSGPQAARAFGEVLVRAILERTQ